VSTIKLVGDKAAWLRALLPAAAAAKSSKLQVLECVHLQNDLGSLKVSGSDLERQITTIEPTIRVRKSAEMDEGFCLDAKKITAIIKLADTGAPITLHCPTESEGAATLICGHSRYKINSMPGSVYPLFSLGTTHLEILVPASALAEMIDIVSVSMAQNDVRFALNGCLFEFSTYNEKTRLRLVSSDGHRLSMSEHIMPSKLNWGDDIGFIVPRQSVIELRKLCLSAGSGYVTISANANAAAFGFVDGTTFDTKLIDGGFPDYARVVPKPSGIQYRCQINTQKMASAIARVAVLQNVKHKGIRLEADPSQPAMEFQSGNDEAEQANEVAELEQMEGNRFVVGFNGVYLSDAVSKIRTKSVSLEFPDGLGSCLMTEVDPADSSVENVQHVVMPMRL
jgi:DNA polymerase-3 subunit beta